MSDAQSSPAVPPHERLAPLALPRPSSSRTDSVENKGKKKIDMWPAPLLLDRRALLACLLLHELLEVQAQLLVLLP